MRVDWLPYREQIISVRTRVFVEEQGITLDDEMDGLDSQCRFVIALSEENLPVGTARLLPGGQIGRMAVLRPWRGRGVGRALLREIMEVAREAGLTSVFLHAQVQALPFYEKSGFTAEGPLFQEAGIPHRLMRYNFTGSN
jgi:predicted GNAT family N-acyltransferase